jgi:peptide/nickel transport system substrate-binding protein
VFGVDSVDPSNKFLRANGEKAMFGWPNIPEVEAEITAWFNANLLAEEQAAARRLNRAALEHAVYAPLGFYLLQHAWRKNVTGIERGPVPFFWGVAKAA